MRDVRGTCRLPAGHPPGPGLRQPPRAARGRNAPAARFAAKWEGPAPPDTAPPVAANVRTSRRTVYQQSLSGAGKAEKSTARQPRCRRDWNGGNGAGPVGWQPNRRVASPLPANDRNGSRHKSAPKKLSVTLGEQEDTPLQVWGFFADGSKIDVTRSTRATYTSDRPTVAAVTKEGGVSGVAAGKARITVKYDDKVVVVPVVVTPNPAAGAKEARR